MADQVKLKKYALRTLGFLLLLAGPLGWATAEQIAAVQAALSLFGDPETTAGTVSSAGVAVLLADLIGTKKAAKKAKAEKR